MKPSPQFARGFTLLEIMFVVMLIGLLLAVAFPAFLNSRQVSQDKAVLNNARRLAEAADQYFLETGATSVEAGHLIGATLYVKSLKTIAGETYPSTYAAGITITVTGIAQARTITYAP